MDYTSRQKKLLKILESKSLDSFLVRKKENISYLVGAKGEDAILFISGKKIFLIAHPKYQTEYSKTIKNCQIKAIDSTNQVYKCVKELSKKSHSNRIGFESDNFSYSEYTSLKKNLKNKSLIPLKDVVESLRMIKDKDEVRHLKAACKDASELMNYALKIIRPSIKEISLKNKIEEYIAKKGIKKADFDIIVTSGSKSSMPHGCSSGKKIKKGEMVVIDLGTMNYGYNSDLTRTVFLGRIERKYLRIYNIVLDAQKKAIENIRPGVSATYIDNISRQYIVNRGLGKYFIHGLGHGIGLEVHEKPNLSKNNSIVLEKNMVVTIEPGVYIPGWGGIRIEDDVLITKSGSRVLTKSSKKLLCK